MRFGQEDASRRKEEICTNGVGCGVSVCLIRILRVPYARSPYRLRSTSSVKGLLPSLLWDIRVHFVNDSVRALGALIEIKSRREGFKSFADEDNVIVGEDNDTILGRC